jgi:membrane-associated phospholipid phosphatase
MRCSAVEICLTFDREFSRRWYAFTHRTAARRIVVRSFVNVGAFEALIAVLAADPAVRPAIAVVLPRMALCAVIVRGVIVAAFHALIPRERPFVVFGVTPIIKPFGIRAFPSAHAAFFGGLTPFLWAIAPWMGAAALAIAVVNGAARVAGALHWPSDVIVGIAIGLVAGMVLR